MPTDEPKEEKDNERRDLGPEGPEAEAERGVRARLEALIPDLVKKTFYAGLGAVFTTEEGIRKITNDFSLPKDVASYIINSAQGTKDELLRIVGKEMREFLQGLNMSQELAKLLTQLSFEIKTEIRFIPNDEALGGVKRDIKNKVSLKRTKPDGTTEITDVGEQEPKKKSDRDE